MVKCAAILLAAGQSTRMGCLKALLPWEGKTLLAHQLAQLNLSNIDQTIVVIGYQANKLLPFLKNISVDVVWNEQFEKGKTESIKRGILSINEQADCILIVSVDQPVNQLVLDEMIIKFMQTKSKIILPVHDGKRGHPILFSTELIAELLEIKEETNGLKEILHKRNYDILELMVTDQSVLFNFNTQKEYDDGIYKGGPNTI